MKRILPLAFSLAGLGWLIDVMPAPALAQSLAQRCTSAAARVDAAIAARDLPGAVAAAEAYAPLPGCDDETDRIPRLRRTARLLLDTATGAGSEARAPTEVERLLATARRVAPTWDVLKALADRRHQARAWAEATTLYQAALNDLADWDEAERAPDEATIRQIYQRAAETALLAPDVDPQTRRTGQPGGLDLALRGSIRNVAITVRPMPITFEFARAAMTERGRRVAEIWWESVRNGDQPDIIIIGHTDPIGSDTINDPLSVARARAVQDFLASRGYRGVLRVTGYGKRCPIEVSGGAQYERQELHQILRRVEMIVGPAIPATHCRGIRPVQEVP